MQNVSRNWCWKPVLAEEDGKSLVLESKARLDALECEHTLEKRKPGATDRLVVSQGSKREACARALLHSVSKQVLWSARFQTNEIRTITFMSCKSCGSERMCWRRTRATGWVSALNAMFPSARSETRRFKWTRRERLERASKGLPFRVWPMVSRTLLLWRKLCAWISRRRKTKKSCDYK